MTRRYSVHVDGFDPAVIEASSAGAARYRAYQNWLDAGYGRVDFRTRTFGEFLERVSTTICLGPTLSERSSK